MKPPAWIGTLVMLIGGALDAPATVADCFALTGGRALLPGGQIEAATIVIDGEAIRAAGPSVVVPPGCRSESVVGKVVSPGLIDAASTIGLSEIDLESSTHDDDSGGADPIRASFRVAEGYNPQSTLIPIARLGGVTSAVILPSGGSVAGQAALVDLAGASQASAVQRSFVAMVAGLDPTTGSTLRRFRELFSDARRFAAQRLAWERNQTRTFPWNRLDLEALLPVLDRKVPLLVAADRASDIEALLAFAQEQDVRLVIVGAAEAHLVAPTIASANVPVILDPLVYGPGSFDQLHGRPDNAALLQRAGVTVAIASFSGHNARKLRQLAGNAVREGLPHAAALEAITRAPATIFGLERYGRLVGGAVANLVVWSGDPLEISTQVEQVYVRGVRQSLRTRQSELLERYRTLPGTPPPPLRPR